MSEWKEFKIGEIFKLRQGRYVNSDIMSDSSSAEKPYPVFGGNGVRGYVDFYEYEKSQAIVTCRGNGCGLIQFLPPKSTITNSSIAFELKDDSVEMEFLYYWAKNADFSEVTSGSAQPQITIGDISSKEILLPPLPEQKAIAEVLTSLDDKIDLLHKQNKTLEQLAETLFRHHFIDNAQDDWGDGKLGDFLTPKKGKNITKSQVIEGLVPVIAGGLSPSCFHNEANTSAPVITISASGANAGHVALHHKPVWSSDSSFIDKSITPYVYFFYVFLKTNQEKITDKQEGSAQPHIYPSHLMDLDILKYPDDLILESETFLEQSFIKIGANIEQIQNLEKLRDQLLPKLMSGEIRLN